MSGRRLARMGAVCAAVLSASTFGARELCANENVVGRPKEGATISPAETASAQVRSERTLTRPEQLSKRIQRELFGPTPYALPLDAHKGRTHPFTTKRASADDIIAPVDKYPFRAAGKLFQKFGGSLYVCTASVIEKSLLVTAAHCVHNFGAKAEGFADWVVFEPARNENTMPFGEWTAKEWWIPKVYFEGNDKCSTEAPGVVCENDVAVVVLQKQNDKFVSDVTGKFGFNHDGYGYGSLFGLKTAQITQLGYPALDYDGVMMIRTDSLGYQDDPNNVIIGSAQTGGSSGGPWLMNFGVKPSRVGGQPPKDDDDNQVVATTSWGYGDGRVMVQGASRFSKNTTYTIKSNIESLIESACKANPGSCDGF